MRKIDKEELHDIFKGISENNENYFNKLYEKYNMLIYGIAFSILKNRENSEEVVQKVFIKIWEMEKEKLPRSSEATWLYTLTKNETLNFLKNLKLEENIEDIYYLTDEDEEIKNVVDQDSFNRIISKLDMKEQEIISLKLISNLSFMQISQILNIPIGTVKWKYYKSMHTLKLLFGNLLMFIITFVIGLKTLLSKKQNATSSTSDKINESEIIEDSTYKEEQKIEETETSNSFNHKEELENIVEDKTENLIVEEQINTNIKANYYGIGILSLSSIFLIFTIIFTIFLIKHQPKHNKKMSK